MSKEELDQKSINEMIDKARLNLVAYRKIMLPCGPDEVMPASFHYTWSDFLLHDKDNAALEAFRESAKTQYALRSFLLYALTFPSVERDYIVLIKKNATLASNKLKEIESEYTTNPLVSANRKEIKEQSSNVFSVDVEGPGGKIINVRIEAYGKGASVRGLANIDRRPKIVIIDDPQDIEDSRSEAVTENDWDWFLSDIAFLGQNTRIFLIGNNLGEKCIIERVFAMEGKLEKIKFKTMRVATLTPEGNSSWPSKYTVDEIRKEKGDFERFGKLEIWLRERMCQATSDETRIFNDGDYRYYAAPVIDRITAGFSFYATLDPAHSQRKTACYRAITINAVSPDNYWFIVKILFGRWDAVTTINNIFDMVSQYYLKDFAIEKGEYKDIIESFIFKEMSKRNIFFNIVPLEHAKQGSKLERIKMLQPRFKAHTIMFPDDSPDWLVELKSELKGVTNTVIKSLFIDLVDSLAMQEQVAIAPVNQARARRDLPRDAVAAECPI